MPVTTIKPTQKFTCDGKTRELVHFDDKENMWYVCEYTGRRPTPKAIKSVFPMSEASIIKLMESQSSKAAFLRPSKFDRNAAPHPNGFRQRAFVRAI